MKSKKINRKDSVLLKGAKIFAMLLTFFAFMVFVLAGDVIFKAGDLNITGDTVMGGNLTFTEDKGIKTLVSCRAGLYTTQSNIAEDTYTKINLRDDGTRGVDLGGDFDNTNHRFTAPVSGYYHISASVTWGGNSADEQIRLRIYKGGATAAPYAYSHTSVSGYHTTNIGDIIYLVAGEYIELWTANGGGGGGADIRAGESYTFMSVHLLSVA